MPRFNQQGVVQVLVLLILIIGLLAGLYLITQTQIFKSKATSQNIEWQISSGQSPDNCVTTQDGKTVTTCPKVKFKVTAPADITPTTSSINYGDFNNEDD